MTTDASASNLSSFEERHKAAVADLSSLGRVSHRLALVDTSDRLSQVLEKLLPRLLKKIGNNHQEQLTLAKDDNSQSRQPLIDTLNKVHAKLVETLSHTMRRVRDDQACKLPCQDILNLLLMETQEQSSQEGGMDLPIASPAVDPFTLNLALAFLTLGVPRCDSREDIESLLPGLLVLVGHYSGLSSIRTAARKSQSHQTAHLLLRVMERLVKMENDLSPPKYGVATKRKLPSGERGSNGDSSDSTTTKKSIDFMTLAREVCCRDAKAASAVFELLLDGLLYQPVSGNVPPSGLSSSGHERLKSGSSKTERDWAAEKAPRMKLCEFKLSLLDFVAPSRRWALFMANKSSDNGNNKQAALGVSRTVGLLVAASGDPNPEVSQRASTYLKIHHDSFRGSSSQQNSGDKGSNDNTSSKSSYADTIGDASALTCTLLMLALGQTNAESAMTRIATTAAAADLFLGIKAEEPISTDSSQLILSLKRRAGSESTIAAIVNYIATKVFEDNPQLFRDGDSSVVQQMATLPLMVAQRTLASLRTASGLSILQAKPYVAAAALLNILSVRVASFFDSQSLSDDSSEEKKDPDALLSSDNEAIILLLAGVLSTACSILAPASALQAKTSNSAMVSNEGSISVRDSCYGVVCTLSRSRFALAKEGYIFMRGVTLAEASTNGESRGPVVSTDTASLLFGCAANEVERLRPRSVAALDALLGAYCRVHCNQENKRSTDEPQGRQSGTAGDAVSNPWGDISTSVVSDAHSVSSGGLTAAKWDNVGLTKALLPILWSASQSSQSKSSRVASARWSSELLKHLDLPAASHLLCFLAGDTDVTASNIARDGLGLPNKLAAATFQGDDGITGAALMPTFGEYASVLFPANQRHASASSAYWRPRYWDFSFAGKSAAMRFGLMCLFNDIYGGEDDAVLVYVKALADTLVLFGHKASGAGSAREGEIELLEECAMCLLATLSTSQYARKLIGSASESSDGEVALGLEDVCYLAQYAKSSRARRHLAGACGHLYDDLSLWDSQDDKGKTDLQRWLDRTNVHRTLEACSTKLADVKQSGSNLDETTGLAILGAQCVRAFLLHASRGEAVNHSDDESVISCWNNVSAIIGAFGRATEHTDETVGNTFADSLAIALSYKSLDAPILDQRLYGGIATALTRVASGLSKYSNTDNLDAPRVSRLARAAGHCLAASTSGAGTSGEGDNNVGLGPARILCVNALFSLLGSPANRKDEEIALVVGEALALYSDASPETAVWASEIKNWPGEFDEKVTAELPPHQQVLVILLRNHLVANSPHKRTACAPALLGVIARAASGVNHRANYSNRLLVREIIRHFGEVLDAFIKLLSDPKGKQLSREACCFGLAACRGLANAINFGGGTSADVGSFAGADELNQKLLRAFGQTTNYGGSAYQESAEQAAARRAVERSESSGNSGSTLLEPFGEEEATQVGGVAGLGEASLGAYREMASAAVSLGRHDVLYALLLLSVSHSIWFSPASRERYSASSLLGQEAITGSNACEMRRALRPHLGKLLPRILRATHDPNKQTREQMASLWAGITGGGADARGAITQHLLPTIDALIDDASNKFWRARVGACGSLSEIIVGRTWRDLGGGGAAFDELASDSVGAAVRLLRLWRISMRALDDVRSAVRENGETLARAVRGLSIRLCDPDSADNADGGVKRSRDNIKAHETDASAAAATTLRWLIKNGLNQQCAEATGICISCLVEVIDVVRPTLLNRLIPDLLKSLLGGMSSLEPSALNYLQLRSGSGSGLSYEELERARLRLASSGPLASAVQKLLDMLPRVNIEIQQEVVQALDDALRVSVGFATRAATADAVSTLCSSCPKAFSFSGASNTNPSVRLLRALYFASERERGQAARDKMIHALGGLAGLCPGMSVRSLAKKACEKYTSSTGNNDDPSSRRASASAIRAIAVRAGSQLSDGGPSDIWNRKVLPVAYLGQHDSESKIALLWKEVWDEGSSICIGKDSFGTTNEENLLPHLIAECCKAVNEMSWSLRIAGALCFLDLCAAGVLAPAPRRLRNGKAKSDASFKTRSLRRAKASTVAVQTCVTLLTRSRLWTGKSEVLKAAVGIAAKWSSAVADAEHDEETLFGWDVDGEPCPWKPIILSPFKFGTDLFVGDSWFAESHEELEPDTVVLAASDAMEVDDDIDETLNFEECTNEVENEDEMQHTSEDENNVPPGQTSGVTFTGLCRLLLDHGFNGKATDSDEWLPYRTAAFACFRDLMASLNESKTATEQKQDVFKQVSPKLISLFDSENRFGLEPPKSKEAPVVIARAIDGVAASLWSGFGSSEDKASTPTADALELADCLRTAGGSTQPAWTVRESACLCAASLAAHCHPEVLRNHKFVSILVACSTQSQKDRKFWRVRFAGLKVLSALVSRKGTRDSTSVAPNSRPDQENLLIMEAMLPHKESILKIARSSLGDSEAKVTALSSDVIGKISWWP